MPRLTVVLVAHVDTGPLWYQWIARAGHDAWLWYGTDGPAGAERLVRETSPDVLVVHATSTDDPGWAQIRLIRERFAHARLPLVCVGNGVELSADQNVVVMTEPKSAEALLEAVDIAARRRDGDEASRYTL